MARGAGAARKKSLNPGDGDDGRAEWDWDNKSVPLKTSGKEAKFTKPPDKFSSTEGETAFVIFDVQGDPAPTVEWFKMSKDLVTEPRCKMWTDKNRIIMGMQKTKQEDEGTYRCVITNEHGSTEHEYNIYITVAGGMDFRAMLMRKKKPAKKSRGEG